MKHRTDLHEKFVKELFKKVPQRPMLINTILDILHLERESVSRRLSEKVQFSVREVGILAQELDISLDSILNYDTQFHWMPFILESPLGYQSMETIYDIIENTIAQMNETLKNSAEYGIITNAIPLEFYVNFPYLMKFSFFKWGQYFIGTEEFNSFSTWELPHRIVRLKEPVKSLISKMSNSLYIWDHSIIWTLMGEIEYFYKMNVLTIEDVKNIKNDLKDLLNLMEKHLKGISKTDFVPQNTSFYISNINLGTTCWYLFSEKKRISFHNSSFTISTPINNSTESHNRIKNWIDSFKNISVLISGCGELERRSFFNKQHKIIDEYFSC